MSFTYKTSRNSQGLTPRQVKKIKLGRLSADFRYIEVKPYGGEPTIVSSTFVPKSAVQNSKIAKNESSAATQPPAIPSVSLDTGPAAHNAWRKGAALVNTRESAVSGFLKKYGDASFITE